MEQHIYNHRELQKARVLQSYGVQSHSEEGKETKEYQKLENEGVVSDNDADNKKDDEKKGEDIKKDMTAENTPGPEKVEKSDDSQFDFNHLNKARLSRANGILKTYGIDIEKGGKGEGSRGGKVIGHTKSGKPVYEGHGAKSKLHSDFSKQDHEDAAELHATSVVGASDMDNKIGQMAAQSHRNAATENYDDWTPEDHDKKSAFHEEEMHKRNSGSVETREQRAEERKYHREEFLKHYSLAKEKRAPQQNSEVEDLLKKERDERRVKKEG